MVIQAAIERVRRPRITGPYVVGITNANKIGKIRARLNKVNHRVCLVTIAINLLNSVASGLSFKNRDGNSDPYVANTR